MQLVCSVLFQTNIKSRKRFKNLMITKIDEKANKGNFCCG